MLIGFIFHTPELRMNYERPRFASQKAIFYNAKGRVSHCETRPFDNSLAISELTASEKA